LIVHRDNKNLYFLVVVNDDVIIHHSNYTTNCDYGWIEDSAGNKVWQISMANSKHAGGAEKNRIADTTVLLNSGKYSAHYITDESHAYHSWDDDPPKTTLYGLRISWGKGLVQRWSNEISVLLLSAAVPH
jgi:hypothetical protein